jgi:hypothetical protein
MSRCGDVVIPTCPSTPYQIKDTDDNVLYQGTIISGEVLIQQIANSVVSNSNDSYSIDLLSQQNLDLPNINFTDSDGTKVEVDDADTVNGLQFVSSTITSTVSTISLSLGINNKRYTITCRITTAGGLHYERSVFLRVREK